MESKALLRILIDVIDQKSYWRRNEIKAVILNILADEEPREMKNPEK